MSFRRSGVSIATLVVAAMVLTMVVGSGANAARPSTNKIAFSVATQSVYEGEGSATIQLWRSALDGPASVTVTTVRGTATAGTDYTAVDQQVMWQTGQFATVEVPILVDGVIGEGAETVKLQLSAPSGAYRLTNPKTMILTINEMPTPPAPVLATPTAANPIVLSWTEDPFAYGTLTFAVYRSTEPASAVDRPVGQLASGLTELTYTDAAVTAGSTYYYWVTAGSPDGEISGSNEVSVTVPSPVLTPPKPTIDYVTGFNQSDVRWTIGVYSDPVTFEVYRSDVSGFTPDATTLVASNVASITIFTGEVRGFFHECAVVDFDPTSAGCPLVLGGTYYYVVRAVNGSGVAGPYSDEASVKIVMS
jgi:hypothetical protein